MNDETIEFAMHLTGSDREDMERTYSDWSRSQAWKRNEEFWRMHNQIIESHNPEPEKPE
jgi:hypothetical protein